MRHQKAGRKFNRTSSHRDAMFRNMVTSLFAYGKIRTTDAKAKELRRWADKMITLAKRGDLHARRQAMAVVRSKDVVHKLFEEASERFGSRSGGYTRIIKLGRRAGDGALISLIEFVGPEEKKKKKKKVKKTAKKTAPKPKKETAVKPEAKKEEAPEKADVKAEEAPKEEAEVEAGADAPQAAEETEEQGDAAAEDAGETAPVEETAEEPAEDKEKSE